MVPCVNVDFRFHFPHRLQLDTSSPEGVFTRIGLFDKDHKPAVTLNTTFAHLGLRDAPFDILPMCEDIHQILPADMRPLQNPAIQNGLQRGGEL